MSFDINEFYNQMLQGKAILSIKGSITTDVINKALEDIEVELDAHNVDFRVRKKIYNILVECLQNLFHHVEDIPKEVEFDDRNRFGILVVYHNEQGYFVKTANFIFHTRIKPLKEKIDKINSLNQDELKDLYKFILNHQKLSAKGGGGLGLIDIARKTGRSIDYTFLPVTNDYYLFNLEINLPNE